MSERLKQRKRKSWTALLVLTTVAVAADARVTSRTDTKRWEQGQGENTKPCVYVRACVRFNSPILITWGIPQEW